MMDDFSHAHAPVALWSAQQFLRTGVRGKFVRVFDRLPGSMLDEEHEAFQCRKWTPWV